MKEEQNKAEGKTHEIAHETKKTAHETKESAKDTFNRCLLACHCVVLHPNLRSVETVSLAEQTRPRW